MSHQANTDQTTLTNLYSLTGDPGGSLTSKSKTKTLDPYISDALNHLRYIKNKNINISIKSQDQNTPLCEARIETQIPLKINNMVSKPNVTGTVTGKVSKTIKELKIQKYHQTCYQSEDIPPIPNDSKSEIQNSHKVDVDVLSEVRIKTHDHKVPDTDNNHKIKVTPSNIKTKKNTKPNFKNINFYAWQKSLITQFGDSLPYSQLLIKDDISSDSFDHVFGRVHSLTTSRYKTDSWFDLNVTPFKSLEPGPRPPDVCDDMWNKYLEYLKSFDVKPFIPCNPSQLDNKSKVTKANKMIILPTKTQQHILFNWFEGYRLMYNETVKFINKNKYHDGPQKGEYITSDTKIRDVHLKDKKKEIIEKMKMVILAKDIDFDDSPECHPRKEKEGEKPKEKKANIKPKIKKEKERKDKTITIPVHILDDAIQSACAMFKSAITNKKNGHIKSFRIRCIKQSKKDKQLYIQTDDFRKNGFFSTAIGHMALKEMREKKKDKDTENKNTENVPLQVKVKEEEDVVENLLINKKIEVSKSKNKAKAKTKRKTKIKSDEKNKDDKNDKNNETGLTSEKKKRGVRKKNPDREKRYFRNIEVTGRSVLYYNHSKDRFELHMAQTVPVNDSRNSKQIRKYIGLDAGIRAFLTGLSNQAIIEIGTNLSKMIEDDLRILDQINNNPLIPKKIKKKYETRINGRIHRRVEDLHWKIINYLTSNYDHIILGNLSTKSIVRVGGVLCPMTKRVANAMAFYQFVQRLKYKCESKRINFQLINEYLTSKLCSGCGEKNEVGGDKIYECETCGIRIDRDVNGAKNIVMRGLASKEEIPLKTEKEKKEEALLRDARIKREALEKKEKKEKKGK